MDALPVKIFQSSLTLPFGLHFRQVVVSQALSPFPNTQQSTSEPEITTRGDGKDPNNIDADWIADEDDDEDE